MLPQIKSKIKKIKPLTAFLVTGIIAILILGLIQPVITSSINQNWEKELTKRIFLIESESNKLFKQKEKSLLNSLNKISYNIKTKKLNDPDFDSIDKSIKPLLDDNISLQIFDNSRKVIYWNGKNIKNKNITNVPFEFGETHFYNDDLEVKLIVEDTLQTEAGIIFIQVSKIIQKKYLLQNQYFNEIDFEKDLSEKFRTVFDIEYTVLTKAKNDGRLYSFDILNNFNNKIGQITFDKPLLTTEINLLSETFINIQSVILVFILILIGLKIKNEISRTASGTIKFVVLSGYMVLFRYVLYFLDFPGKILEGPLTNPAYFSSKFAFGIVSSPIEFLISAILFFLICLTAFRITINKIDENRKNIPILFSYTIVFISSILLLISLRGYGASVRSIIFDSTLRYLKDTNIFLDLPSMLMQLNLFLLGYSSILASVVLVVIIAKTLPLNNYKINIKYFIFLFLSIQLMALIYDELQANPQGTPVIRIIFITLVFVISYFIVFRRRRDRFMHAAIALAGAFISVNMLMYYNTELEKESLKITATEFTQPNENMMQFLVNETLIKSESEFNLEQKLKNSKTNYNALAFSIWSRSSLHREGLKSGIVLFDRFKREIGYFSYGINDKILFNNFEIPFNLKQIEFKRISNDKNKIVIGIKPVLSANLIIGFVGILVDYNYFNNNDESKPEFLYTKSFYANSTVGSDEIIIFDYYNSEPVNIFGNIIPPKSITSKILNAEFNQHGETSLNIEYGKDKYSSYLRKIEKNKDTKILAVLLKQKTLTWNLYNFFKLFFIQTLFIIILIFILILIDIRNLSKIKFTFRTQLLIAFLILSLIPLILSALYYRNFTDDKKETTISYYLKSRATKIKMFVDEYLASTNNNIIPVLETAGKDLDINFAFYEGGDLIFSTNDNFYNSNLISTKLSTDEYLKLFGEGYYEIMSRRRIDNYFYNSLLFKLKKNGSEFVIEVNDAFNPVLLPLSGSEVDIFLFGSYSFAAILIIIASTLLANQISSPIRKLTIAAKSVAGGDLNFNVELSQKGEIKDLVDNFNIMISELKKSQEELALFERENAWKEMAKQVAHEIKNPLTPMRLSVQHLVAAYKEKSIKFDEIFIKVTNTLINQIEILKNIASEFSNFARMPHQKLEKIDIVSIINEIISLFIEEKVKIDFLNDNNFIYILGDSDQFKRTIINLIRNSIQAEASKISFMIDIESKYVLIKITDNGKGIDSVVAEKIFESGFTTKEKGMGIGLKISKRYIEGLDGELFLESSVPGNTVFIIKLKKINDTAN